jgi:hypothetical protein
VTGIDDRTHIAYTIRVVTNELSIFNQNRVYRIHKSGCSREFITGFSGNTLAWHSAVKAAGTNLF